MLYPAMIRLSCCMINLWERIHNMVQRKVWIGFGSCIMKGVTIGEGAVIVAHAVVTRDVPSGVLVGGNPAHIIKTIPSE